MRPILYSFLRCPYAIRARIALYYSGVQCELREVVLKSKPPALLSISQKATVPVMLLNNQASGDARLIEESIEIVEWALSQSDPDGWLDYSIEHELIKECDDRFKYWLDRYKYADRFTENTQEYYFDKACDFLSKLESSLQNTCYIYSPKVSVLDVAIFPFVRQFAFVNKERFDGLPFTKLQAWLDKLLESDLFLSVMNKYPMWVENESDLVIFGCAGSS